MPSPAAPWDAVSHRYDTWVISPFAPGVAFPLRADVRRLLAAWKHRGSLHDRVVLDVGCGRGDGLALVAGRVGVAVGLDFSPRMLDLSARFVKARGIGPVRYPRRGGLRRLGAALRARAADGGDEQTTALAHADMRALAPLRGCADLVLAISSISPARPGRAARAFGEVASCLKAGGTLMAVFASLDSFQYLVALADRLGVELPDVGHVDRHGMFHEHGEQQQFFTPEDIRRLCAGEGLRVRALKKVRYPWATMRRFGWGYFPGRPQLWDWYLLASAKTPPRGASVPRADPGY
jgi:SAM-dependent methyltransferase